MRLGQLARQLDIKTNKIVQFLEKEKQISIKTHPNAKVDDELIEEITNYFKPNKVDNADDAPIEKVKKVEEVKSDGQNGGTVKEEVTPEPEQIVTPKIELGGPKIIGKIDLPDKKDIQVEIDGVVYDQEFLDKKKKEELKEKRKQLELEKEQKKKEEAERRRIALEKKKLEEERQAMLAQEENNTLSAEEERKRELIRKAQEERERKLEEKRKQRQKEFYAKKHALKNPPKKKKRKNKNQPEAIEENINEQQPKETNPIKRFIKWLNT